MFKKYAVYILAVALFILGLSLGFAIGKNFNTQKPQDVSTIPETTKSNSFYSLQTASIRGVITDRNGNDLKVKNLNNQVEGSVKASNRLIIAKAGNKPNPATPSSDLSSIELNKEALISLEMIDGEYQAVLVQYTLPSPSIPPLPK